jgi:hypothetical protein
LNPPTELGLRPGFEALGASRIKHIGRAFQRAGAATTRCAPGRNISSLSVTP